METPPAKTMAGKASDLHAITTIGNDSQIQYPEDTPEAIKDAIANDRDPAVVRKVSHISQVLSIWISGLALFSDGYNAQISKFYQRSPWIPSRKSPKDES